MWGFFFFFFTKAVWKECSFREKCLSLAEGQYGTRGVWIHSMSVGDLVLRFFLTILRHTARIKQQCNSPIVPSACMILYSLCHEKSASLNTELAAKSIWIKMPCPSAGLTAYWRHFHLYHWFCPCYTEGSVHDSTIDGVSLWAHKLLIFLEESRHLCPSCL